ncbi:MAG TPA: PadR family transcriptional regulator [Candidatus Dormibacteraeota bacterium]|nr:PadR family transcriptional regulator [Candidatus Dormibacteraeota bacterium]
MHVRRGAEHIRDRIHHARHDHPGPGRPPFGPGAFGRGFPFGTPFPGGGRRAGRGDIRAAILALLAEQPMHGYQIIQELSERSGGAWRPSPGSVYPTLQQLEDEGLVRAEAGEGRTPFILTDAGKAYVEEKREELGEPWAKSAAGFGEGRLELRELIGQIAAAAYQVSAAGDTTQIARAKELMTQTRRGLYQILADDQPDEA